MLLTEWADLSQLIFPVLKWVHNNLMVFRWVFVDGFQLSQIVEVHFDEVTEPVAVDLKIGVCKIDGLV